MAVATQREGFSTLKEITPGLIFHATTLLTGMILMGLGQKVNVASTRGRGDLAGDKR